jgi:TatA/E family protein of Tat protein translocase
MSTLVEISTWAVRLHVPWAAGGKEQHMGQPAIEHVATVALSWVGWPEVVIIAVVLLVLFGGKKLPDLARTLARSLLAFKRELHGKEGDSKPGEDDSSSKDDGANKEQR